MKNRILTFTFIMTVLSSCSQANQKDSPIVDASKQDTEQKAFEIEKSNPLYNLLGKDVFGKEAFEFTSSLGISETESMQSNIHLQYFASGVEIVYNSNDEKITAIFLLAPNYSNWYEPYAEKLPNGFNWNMTKSDVENIIGYGEERQLMSDVYYQYKHHKIEIEYFKGSENPKMKSIQIRNFEK